MLNKLISSFVWCNAVLKRLSTAHSNLEAGGLCPLQSPGTPLAWPDCENKLQMTKCNCNFKSRNQSRHNKPQCSQLACHNSCVWNSTVKAFTLLYFLHGALGAECPEFEELLISRSWLQVYKLLYWSKKYLFPTPTQLSLCHASPNNLRQCQCQLGI